MASPFSQQLATLRPKITLPETEESWDNIARSVSSLTVLIRDGMPDEIIDALREFSRNITNALRSERTRLCGPAMELISAVSSELGMSFEPLLPIYFPVLLNLCARTNKVIGNRARATVFSVIENTQLPAVIPYLFQNIKDKSTTLRLVAAESTITCLTGFDPAELQKESRSQDIEAIIKATSRDANADVRKAGKRAFNAYKVILPNRVEKFVTPLTPTIRKYLEIRPKATTSASSDTTSHPTKKPSTSQLSSSTSAASNGRHSRTNSTSTSRNAQPPARPVSVPPTNPATSANTLTASQRDAVRAAMTAAPTRPPQMLKSQSSNPMAPPSMPIRPALHLSRPPSSTSLHAPPQRPNHSRGASASSSNSTTVPSGAPVRMQPAPMRVERSRPEEKAVLRQPPPQRFPIASVEEGSGGERGEKKAEVPKPVPQPTNRLRTRAVSMKNLKVGMPPAGSSSSEKDKQTDMTSHSTAGSSLRPVVVAAPKASKPIAKAVTQGSGATARIASKVANTEAFKPTTTARVRPGLTAPTASSQSKSQPKVIQTKKSVAALNVKGKEPQGSGSSSGTSRPGIQSKKSSVDLRRQREEQDTKPKARSRAATASSSSRPPSRKGEPVSRPPSRKETPQPPQPEPKPETEDVEETIEADAAQGDAAEEERTDQPVAGQERSADEEESATSRSADAESQSSEASVTTNEVVHPANQVKREITAGVENQPPAPPQIQVDEDKCPQDPHTPSTDRGRRLGEIEQIKTPISALLLSIEEGFMFSPVRPLSPPEKYLHMDVPTDGAFRFGIPAFNKVSTNDERAALGDLEVNQ
ncbi:hypothetical protein AAF712_001597 [Marasmius tenuissimus]|uniref:CLASP N-terminal domain-containing protein n=1 Tax=Marasmius tenuissimus TaxID=585030 RepID=A0ABR3ACB6_9AGAR